MTPAADIQAPDLDESMMRRALQLAACGVGLVSPGPLVGTVIADREGSIVGEGFYLYEQVKHAETVALEQAGEKARGGTAYVTLEPHSHHGRTEPCTDALINAGISRVVAPIEDPNPKVSGRGFAHLRDAGIEVSRGLLIQEASRLNEAYIHFMRTGRPFVHLKMAVSLDGKIATRTGDSRWITGPEARQRAHELRHQYDAIMVGGGTVEVDDPLLTDRSGKKRRRALVRVVVDGCLRTPPTAQLARTTDEGPVIVYTRDVQSSAAAALRARSVKIIPIERGLTDVLQSLAEHSIQSVLVEGGATLAALLWEEKLANKITFFIAPVIIGGQGAPSAVAGTGAEKMADALWLEDVVVNRHGPDIEVTGYPNKSE